MNFKWSLTIATAVFGMAVAGVVTPHSVKAQQAPPQSSDAVTFTKDIAPILQIGRAACRERV